MSISFLNSTWRNNSALIGGAVALDSFIGSVDEENAILDSNLSQLSISNCVFDSNRAATLGGALSLTGGMRAAGDCFRTYTHSVWIWNSSIRDNWATLGGGAIYATCLSLSLSNTTVSENMVNFTSDPDAVINAGVSSSNIGDTALYVPDSYGGKGGAIYALNAPLYLQNCAFVGNTVTFGNGGALFRTYNWSSTAAAGANMNMNITNDLSLLGNVFRGNSVNASVLLDGTTLDCENVVVDGFGAGVWIQANGFFLSFFLFLFFSFLKLG